MKKISERTSISISLVISILASVAWLTTIYNTGVASASTIKEIQSKQAQLTSEYYKMAQEIRDRLSRIEGILTKKNGG